MSTALARAMDPYPERRNPAGCPSRLRAAAAPAAHGPGRLPQESEALPPGQPWSMACEIRFGALASTPRTIRAHVRGILAIWDLKVLSESAEMIASELSTNAVKPLLDPALASEEHPVGLPRLIGDRPATIVFRMRSDGFRLLVAIWDPLGPEEGMPVCREVGPDNESGRGLTIVQALSEEWGCHPHPDGGKTTRAILRKPDGPRRQSAVRAVR